MEENHASLCAELGESVNVSHDVGEGELLNDVVTSDGSQPLESDTDKFWEHQLNTFKQEIEKLQERFEQSYLEIGRLLIQARDVYKGHGDWIKWLKENVPFSVRHAQRLIRVAEMFDVDGDDATPVSQLGLTSSKAYILTRIGKNDMSNFLKTDFCLRGAKKSIKDMTRRELELEVTVFLRNKLTATDHDGTTSIQAKEAPKDSVEGDLEEVKKALERAIASIKRSTTETRDSWISALEDLCLKGVDELTSSSK